MGADLYIMSVFQSAKKEILPKINYLERQLLQCTDEKAANELKWQISELAEKLWNPESGYFRDSYNYSNVLWALGLSWWRDVGDLLDENGYLHPPEAKRLKDMIESRKHTLEGKPEYFRDKCQKLIRFLDTALELGEPILCSI